MHRARIVRDDGRAHGEDSHQRTEICLTDQIDEPPVRAELTPERARNGAGRGTIRTGAEKDRYDSVFPRECRRDRRDPIRRPALGQAKRRAGGKAYERRAIPSLASQQILGSPPVVVRGAQSSHEPHTRGAQRMHEPKIVLRLMHEPAGFRNSASQ